MNEKSQHAGVIAPPEPFFAELFDELTTRLQAGESVDVEAYLRAHPDHASELQRFLPAIEILVELGRSVAQERPLESAALPELSPRSGVLGDFRILRELGRGAMGLVYEAEQLSLGRRVALKVLPFAATMDPRRLQRFKNEAHAVAQLHHTNIVPVYSVGCERGVHFYAMQFIEGQSLAAVISGLRLQNANLEQLPTIKASAPESSQPTGPYPPAPRHVPQSEICDIEWLPSELAPGVSVEGTITRAGLSTEKSIRSAAYFRTVAQLGIQAAEALDHAHQMGVIHRDIKPANLLVEYGTGGPTGRQASELAAPRLWVADFGLAQVQGDTRLSMTGDLVGTLRYMSPEQALARRVVVDHRTDIYSLGVTLYEFLTLAHAYDGTDREELLRQIAFEEPKPPRRINRAMPPELDIIVLKAMEKNPTERYATAQEMADDLRRFLDDLPIQARRPTLVRRARKWSRRHRSVVWSAVIVLVLAAAMLAGGGIWFTGQRANRLAGTKLSVTAALTKATTHLDEGDKKIDYPERWQADVKLARLAVDQAKGLLATGERMEEMDDQIKETETRLLTAEADSELRAQLERIVLTHDTVLTDGWGDHAQVVPLYANVLRAYGVDPAQPEEAAARVRGSRLRDVLLAAIEDWWRFTPDAAEARRIEEVLRLSQPEPDAFRWRWIKAAHRRDGAALERLAKEVPVDRVSATALLNLIMDLREVAQLAVAERLLRAGLDRYPTNFWIKYQLGVVLMLQRPSRDNEARDCFQAALVLHRPDPVIHHNLAYCLEHNDPDGAVRHYHAALQIDPNFAPSHNNVGRLLMRKGDFDGAVQEFQTAMRLKPGWDGARSNLGLALYYKGDLVGAIRECEAAIGININNAAAHNNLGLAVMKKGDDLERAIREFQAAIQIDQDYADAYYNLGNALKAKGDREGAIKKFQIAIRLNPNDPRASPDYYVNLGNAMMDGGELEDSIRQFRAAIAIDPKHKRAYGSLGAAFLNKGDFEGAIRELQAALQLDQNYEFARNYLALTHFKLGSALALKGNLDGAQAHLETSICLDPKNPGPHNDLGNVLRRKGDLNGAIREHRTAIEMAPQVAGPHFNLASVLEDKHDLDGAVEEYEASIKLDRGFAEAHCGLGLVFLQQGRFAEGLRALKTGHELGSLKRDWPYPSPQWVREAERLVELDTRLPKVLRGEVPPGNSVETASLALFCQERKQLFAAAVRLYGDAFARDARLADDLDAGHRYNAACAAALAGCGQGKDATHLEDKERARLRGRALVWLTADLAYYAKLADGAPAEIRAFIQKRLQHWLRDTDLVGVRGDRLAKLLEAERKDWQQLWTDAERTLKKTNHKVPSEKAKQSSP
jgi:tetratricopeptide (TPR) repeat protein/serine/threonine protein kinase